MSEKSETVNALPCFFPASLDIHILYEGKTGTDILWLFRAGLCGIGQLVDLILNLCGKGDAKNGLLITW